MLERKKIYYVLLLQSLIYLQIPSNKFNKIFFPVFANCESRIKMVIEGSGNQQFLGDEFFKSPSDVLLVLSQKKSIRS